MEGDTNTGSNMTNYQYDIFNRLTRVNDPKLDRTVVYTYDAGGNISCKEIYARTTDPVSGTPLETHTFTYDSVWKDQLKRLSIERNGVTDAVRNISYDAMGNPTRYGSWYMTWTQGRRLERMQAA